MIYLFLSIVISSSLFVIFKLFEVFNINTSQAIVVNYLFAFLTGLGLSEVTTTLYEIPYQPWFLGAVFLGGLFITVFNIMALTSQKNGLSVASVAGKMSVVVPILFGVVMYQESVGVIKVLGILLALVAVYLTSMRRKAIVRQREYLLYPVLLFLGSGIIDTTIKFVETTYVQEGGVPLFSATIFGIAFFLGVIMLSYQLIIQKKRFEPKSIIGGMALGVPNYFSIVFLLKALKTDGLESSTLFTINNVSIVLLTTLFGLVLFKEQLQVKNWIGIAMAILSILLVALV